MPVPWLQIASVGLPLLQKLGESRDVSRYKRQLEQQQKTANLIGALSKGRVQYEPTAEYKPSAFTQLAGAASTGLGAYNTLQDLTAKRAATGVAQQISEAELAKMQREASQARGVADYAQGIGRQVEEAKRLAPGGAGPSLGRFPTFGGEAKPGGAIPAPSMLEQMGRLDPFRVMGQQEAARTAGQQAAADRAAEFERETRRMTAEAQRTRAQAALQPKPLKSMTPLEKTYYNKVAKDMGSLSPHIRTLQDFKNHPSLVNITDDSLLNQMYSSYKVGAQERRGVLGKAANERIEDFSKAVRTQQAVKDRFDIRRSLTEIVDGILIGGGFSDIGVLKALAKLQDPGSVVRQEEFTTLKQGIALFDRAGIKVDQFFTGNQLNADGRRQVLELGYASYNQRRNDIDAVVDNLVSDYSQRPGMVEGLDDAMWANAGLPYRLPDTGELVTEKKMERLRARVGGAFRTDLDDIKQWLVPPPAEVKQQGQNLWTEWSTTDESNPD